MAQLYPVSDLSDVNFVPISLCFSIFLLLCKFCIIRLYFLTHSAIFFREIVIVLSSYTLKQRRPVFLHAVTARSSIRVNLACNTPVSIAMPCQASPGFLPSFPSMSGQTFTTNAHGCMACKELERLFLQVRQGVPDVPARLLCKAFCGGAAFSTLQPSKCQVPTHRPSPSLYPLYPLTCLVWTCLLPHDLPTCWFFRNSFPKYT